MAALPDKMATKEKLDLEAQLPLRPGQPPSPSPGRIDSEYQVSGWTKVYYLAIYFLCNISLTIYNKLILGKVRHELLFFVWSELYISLFLTPNCLAGFAAVP